MTPQQTATDVSGYWSTTDKATEMFPVSLAVCVNNEVAVQKAVSETSGSAQDTEAAMRGDASVTEACVFFNGDLFRNLTVVSSRMELNFEPNSSVLSCATVMGREKQTEKRREAMKARENSVWKVMVIATGLPVGETVSIYHLVSEIKISPPKKI